MIDDRDVRHKCERAVEDSIDDAVMSIGLIDRGNNEDDLDAVAAADGIDGPHLVGNLLLVTRPQRSVGLLQCILVLDARQPLPRLCATLRPAATARTSP